MSHLSHGRVVKLATFQWRSSSDFTIGWSWNLSSSLLRKMPISMMSNLRSEMGYQGHSWMLSTGCLGKIIIGIGSFLYRRESKIFDKPQQFKVQGIGSYLKLKFPQRPQKTEANQYGQVSISVFKVWGRHTGYYTRITN